MEKLTDQELVRRQKMTALKDQGIEPFGQAFTKTHQSAEIFTLYDQYDKETLAEMAPAVIVAGRIMTKREMGKAGFLHLQDQTGQIQVYLRQDSLTPLEFDLFKSADLGDIIGIAGTVFRTNHGELSIKALKYTHLSKALRPLPEKFHGLIDVEERYRRRYLDLIMNERSRYIALSRTKIIRAIQHYFDALGYIEVETPVLQPILGGAAAKPFVTHHNTLDMDFYLRIATELPLKRLIVGGFEGVYEIGRLFRNEGMSPKHNPEFTTVEVYIAYIDMLKMMEVTEQLVEAVSLEVLKTTELTYGEIELSLKAPFKRIHMVDAIKQVTGIDFWTIKDDKTALELAKSHQIPLLSHQATLGHVINAFFEYYVEATIIQPTFVYGHPVDISPLAKRNSKDGRFTDRFELIIAGREYANAFSELNDPIDQKQRFLNQIKEKELGNEEASEMDLDFVEALEYGMPPTAGMGLGIDRLVMLLTNSESIREVILFPHMRNR